MKQAGLNGKTYYIPERWEDLTYYQATNFFISLNAGDNEATIISKLTAIPYDEIMNMSVNSVNLLADKISFCNDLKIFESQEVKEEYKDFDFGSLPYGKTEAIRQKVDTLKSMYEQAPTMFKDLFNLDITDEPFTEWIGTVNFFLSKWYRFIILMPTCQAVSTRMNKNKQVSEGSTDSEVLQLT